MPGVNGDGERLTEAEMIRDAGGYLLTKLAPFVSEYGWEECEVVIKFEGRKINRGVDIRRISVHPSLKLIRATI